MTNDNAKSALEDDVLAILEKAIETAAGRLIARLLRHSKSILHGRRTRLCSFEQRLYERWYKGLDLYELSLYLAQECGGFFDKKFRPVAVAKQNSKFEALIRLHGNAALIAGEVLHLLRGGYASGAHARWRSLHETAVIALFIAGEPDEVAERFLLHRGIKAYEDGLKYKEYSVRLGVGAITEGEWHAIEQEFKTLIIRFGEDFSGGFGWAKRALEHRNPNRKKGGVVFAEIEKAVGVDFWTPYFRMASHAVHPSSTSVAFNIGKMSGYRGILAGPSNAGLADPGHGSLLSLGNTTAALMTAAMEFSSDDLDTMNEGDSRLSLEPYKPGLELAAMTKALAELARLAGDAFIHAHRQLKAEEEEQI